MAERLLFELDGMPALERVHRIFYSKPPGHPWLRYSFTGVPRVHLESQLSVFMSGLFGGPPICGRRPSHGAHRHMTITEEKFLIRRDPPVRSLA